MKANTRVGSGRMRRRHRKQLATLDQTIWKGAESLAGTREGNSAGVSDVPEFVAVDETEVEAEALAAVVVTVNVGTFAATVVYHPMRQREPSDDVSNSQIS